MSENILFDTIWLILFIFAILLIGFFMNGQVVSEDPTPSAKALAPEPIHCESEEVCKQ